MLFTITIYSVFVHDLRYLLVMGRRPPCCDKSHVKKGPWTDEEDAKILAYVASHGIGNWTLVPQKAGLNRCGKSCRLRWTNYLRPDLKHDSFTALEEEIILRHHRAVGSRWSLIAQQLPGRTDNDVKNYWNTKLKKKLLKMGIDPITHKPLSQLLLDYRNINYPVQQHTRPSDQRHHDPPLDFSRADSSLTMMDPFQEHPTPMSLITAHFQVINEAASSSTSSPASKVQVNLPSSPSSWSDYIVGDQEQECTNEPNYEFLSTNGEYMNSYNKLGVDHTKNSLEVNTSSVSFVESILNQDRQLQLDFPQLLDGYSEF